MQGRQWLHMRSCRGTQGAAGSTRAVPTALPPSAHLYTVHSYGGPLGVQPLLVLCSNLRATCAVGGRRLVKARTAACDGTYSELQPPSQAVGRE